MSSSIQIDLAKKQELPSKFTSAEMTEIKNAIPQETANVNIKTESIHIYSPEEHVFGEWREMRDGVLKKKPVYEKTYSYTIPVTSDRTYRQFASFSGIEHLIEGFGYLKEGSIIKQIPYADSSNSGATITYGYPNADSLSIIAYRIGDSTTGDCPSKIIIRYTKTTDQWETVE